MNTATECGRTCRCEYARRGDLCDSGQTKAERLSEPEPPSAQEMDDRAEREMNRW